MCDWLNGELNGKIVILGIGNGLRNDDIAGLKIVQKLEGRLPDNIKLISCGQVPENYTRDIFNFSPDYIIIVDVVEFKGTPGEIRRISVNDIDGKSFSTHNYDISLFIKYILHFHKTEFRIIGIQPKSIDIGETCSEEVETAVNKVVEYLIRKFN